MRKYTKSILTVAAAILAAFAGYATDGITATEWVNVAIAGVGAAAVFAAANVPGAKYTKVILAVLTAVLAFLTTAIVGGLNHGELLQIGILVLNALGVYQFANIDPGTGANLSDTGSLGVG